MFVKSHSQQRGAGLIEVMLALSVFSVSVLGTFGMQIEAKKANYQAAQQSLATSLARDILERMRANRTVLDAYTVKGFTGEGLPAGLNCATAVCNTGQLASRDLYDWGGLLNGEQAQVTIDSIQHASGGLLDPLACIENEAGIVNVTISWEGDSALAIERMPECGFESGSASESRVYVSLKTYIGSL